MQLEDVNFYYFTSLKNTKDEWTNLKIEILELVEVKKRVFYPIYCILWYAHLLEAIVNV